jgi:hypothetical protein
VDDRRRNDRVNADEVVLPVIDGIDNQEIGVIGNVSLGGMMLITTRHLYANGILQLKIDVPAQLGFGLIAMGMKILWCTPANSPNEYWAGLETIDISPDDRASLQHLIDHLSIKA